MNGERTRVLWLIKGLGVGGAERLLVSIAEVRDRERFDYEAAYLLPWKDGCVSDLRRAGVTTHCLNGGREWQLGWALRLRKLLLDRAYDVVHVHSPYVASVARLVVRSLPARRRPRLVSTEHVPWSGYSLPTRVANAVTFALDDAHLAVSRQVVDSVPRMFARRLQVVEGGIDVSQVRQAIEHRDAVRAELGVAAHEVLIGAVANFRAQKAYPDLLRAARLVLDEGLPVRFLAAGQGPLENQIRNLHKALGLGDRFLLLGFRADATRVLAACDIFTLSSLYEGIPVALMEALALGLPVVATRVGGIPEAVCDGVHGVLVPPSRPDALAREIARLARNPQLREQMGRAAREQSLQFEIATSAERLEEAYGRLASRASQRHLRVQR